MNLVRFISSSCVTRQHASVDRRGEALKKEKMGIDTGIYRLGGKR